MIKYLYISFFLILIVPDSTKGQEINFGDYYSYTASISHLNPGSSLDFGDLIQSNDPIPIELSEAKIIVLEGVEYLDVILTVTADANLVNTDIGCSGNCTIPFTLEAGYANLGAENIGQVVPMLVISNVANAQFPILQRSNGAPGPPPTPTYEGFDPTIYNETAFIYVYGSIVVGSAVAGSYESTVTVSVSYD